jgi:hypothetical protein
LTLARELRTCPLYSAQPLVVREEPDRLGVALDRALALVLRAGASGSVRRKLPFSVDAAADAEPGVGDRVAVHIQPKVDGPPS